MSCWAWVRWCAPHAPRRHWQSRLIYRLLSWGWPAASQEGLAGLREGVVWAAAPPKQRVGQACGALVRLVAYAAVSVLLHTEGLGAVQQAGHHRLAGVLQVGWGGLWHQSGEGSQIWQPRDGPNRHALQSLAACRAGQWGSASPTANPPGVQHELDRSMQSGASPPPPPAPSNPPSHITQPTFISKFLRGLTCGRSRGTHRQTRSRGLPARVRRCARGSATRRHPLERPPPPPPPASQCWGAPASAPACQTGCCPRTPPPASASGPG